MSRALLSKPDLSTNSPLYEGWKVSREEYLDLNADGFKYDMIEGVLHLVPSGDFEHGNYQLNFGFLLKGYLKSNPMGKAVTEIDVFLPDGGDVVRPDISLILLQNMSIVKTHIHGVPDLICEVLSPTTMKRDLGIKADRYLKNGVSEYWIVYPKEQKIELWINQSKKSWEKSNSNLLKSSVLKGFKVNQKQFFK
jgi:Uma2 family endonuclease